MKVTHRAIKLKLGSSIEEGAKKKGKPPTFPLPKAKRTMLFNPLHYLWAFYNCAPTPLHSTGFFHSLCPLFRSPFPSPRKETNQRRHNEIGGSGYYQSPWAPMRPPRWFLPGCKRLSPILLQTSLACSSPRITMRWTWFISHVALTTSSNLSLPRCAPTSPTSLPLLWPPGASRPI